jgi:hypothetical protein
MSRLAGNPLALRVYFGTLMPLHRSCFETALFALVPGNANLYDKSPVRVVAAARLRLVQLPTRPGAI